MNKGYVLSLCDRTGNMVRPWLEAGYRAVTIDLQECPEEGKHPNRLHHVIDVRHLAEIAEEQSIATPIAIFAFPPCTHLAASGSRWWARKGLGALQEGISIVHACQRIAEALGAPYVIENPVGALSTHWRKPDYQFNPCDFTGYAPVPEDDAYTKKTCFWVGNGFVMPRAKRVPGLTVKTDKIHLQPGSADQGDERSVTPLGFAYAVFEANCPEKRRLREMMEPAYV